MKTKENIYNKWISIDEWKAMSQSQYAWEFCVVELIYEIGYMGKHLVCIAWEDGTLRTDWDGRFLNLEKVAAIMFIQPFNEKLKE
jgi:hypothetical protein